MANEGPKSGDRVGAYVLEERLGEGGFGEVWRARHSVLTDKVVAAKIPTQTEYIDVLRKEGIIQHQLDHPAIIDLIDLDLDHEPPYMLLEYVDGEDLRKRIDREGALPPAEVCRIGIGLLEPLLAAHEAGTIHRDLKPANVLLSKSGDVKLSDFGLGKAVDDRRSMLVLSQTMQGKESAEIAGTLAYMAPEQRTPGGEIDTQTDIFAFGVILHEMLTGKLPAGASLPSEVAFGLGVRFDDIYKKCCAPREQRYGTGGAVLADLVRVGRFFGHRQKRTHREDWRRAPHVRHSHRLSYSAVEASSFLGIDFLEFKRLEDQGKIPGAWIDGEKRYRASDLLLSKHRGGSGRGDTVAGCSAIAFSICFIVFGIGFFGMGPVTLIFFLPFAVIAGTRGISRAAKRGAFS